MKFLLIDDEHELYKIMYTDLLKKDCKFEIEEVPKFCKMNKVYTFFNKIHFDDRINRHLWLPFKGGWDKYYYLNSYNFDEAEQYWVIFLNGTFRNYYSIEYLKNFRKKHSNVRLALVMYDNTTNPYAQRVKKMFSCFDKIFSFDQEDCRKYNFEYIFSTLSKPEFVKRDKKKESSIFFVGSASGRLNLLHNCMEKIVDKIDNYRFYITGVDEKDKKLPIIYNHPISYADTLEYSFNTDCIFEVVKPGQTGITLRTCEAIIFNKKLLTNNKAIKDTPFYNEKYMSVFENEEDIDLNFISEKIDIDYNYEDWFSPNVIIQKLNEETTNEN